MIVVISKPEKEGKNPVAAVAIPKVISANIAKFCSRNQNKNKITPTAKKPGTSLTVWSHPISTPEKFDTSTTKLFSRAAQIANDIGIAVENKNKRKIRFEKLVLTYSDNKWCCLLVPLDEFNVPKIVEVISLS